MRCHRTTTVDDGDGGISYVLEVRRRSSITRCMIDVVESPPRNGYSLVKSLQRSNEDCACSSFCYCVVLELHSLHSFTLTVAQVPDRQLSNVRKSIFEVCPKSIRPVPITPRQNVRTTFVAYERYVYYTRCTSMKCGFQTTDGAPSSSYYKDWTLRHFVVSSTVSDAHE